MCIVCRQGKRQGLLYQEAIIFPHCHRKATILFPKFVHEDCTQISYQTRWQALPFQTGELLKVYSKVLF